MDEEFSRWADLPSYLLYEISDRLIFYDDYVRFSAVCVSWRIVYDDDQKKKKSSASSSCLPFLLIPPHYHELVGSPSIMRSKLPADVCDIKFKELIDELKRKRRLVPKIRNLYNLVNQKVCDFEVKLSHNYYCRGSSFGWLITFKAKWKFGYIYKDYFQLYNPFLSDKHNIIYLPPFYKKIFKQDTSLISRYRISRPFFYLYKAVLSCNPLFNKHNFVVMAIATLSRKLVFYTPENKDWLTINWDAQKWFKDVVYFNKTQQFYALGADGTVLSIDLIRTAQGQGGGPCIIPKLTQVAPPNDDFQDMGRRYLVETMSGELLHVHKAFANNLKIQVFKLDPITVEWSQIHDIGDTILFIGDNSTISRSASEFPGCKPNCIYFTDDMYPEERYGRLYKPHHMGIYNLADGTHQPHYPTASRINFPAPIWLEPTLQRCSHLRYCD